MRPKKLATVKKSEERARLMEAMGNDPGLALSLYWHGRVSVRMAAESLGIPYATFYRRYLSGLPISLAEPRKRGRRPISLPESFAANVGLYRNGAISGLEAARRCHMPASTFFKKARLALGEDIK